MGATTAKVEEPPRTQASGGFRPVVLRHDPTPSTHRVAPPPQFTRGELQAAQTATINVNFMAAGTTAPLGETCLTWPTDAQTAFNYAVDIWETLIVSSVPIEIDACWTEFSDPNILGYGGAQGAWANFTNAPRANTWYPNALANSLAGADLDAGTKDIVGAYGSTFSWYFGMDGNTPGNQVDFVSVVLHEIAHGLGFSGSMSVSSGQGSWGSSRMPDSYDHFTENGSGQQLINTGIFPNPSAALAAQLTGEDIFFDGPNAVAANGGSRPELYAPSPWDQGSSYAHLDESFNGTENALMTWSLSDGESEHSPGPVALGILEDVGWTLTTVDPAPSLSSITPSSGYNSGTVSITDLAGENFQAGATVKLTRSGETEITATNVTVVDATQITCQFDLLSAATGDWNVVVTNPDSQSGTLTNGFSVQTSPTAPAISTITPSEGGNTQTLQIALTGTNFATSGGTPVVKLLRGDDTITGSGVSVSDSTQLNATVDLNGATPGLWDVSVTNPNGESGILEDAFTVRAPLSYVYLPFITRCYPLAPTLNAISNGDGDGMYTVSWSWPGCAAEPTSYVLEADTSLSFSNPSTFYPTDKSLALYSPDPATYYYRVRATGSSDWSNVRSTTVTREFAYLYIDNDTGGNLTVEAVGVAKRSFSPGLHYWRSFIPGTYTFKAWAHCGSGQSTYNLTFGEQAIQYQCGAARSTPLQADMSRPTGGGETLFKVQEQ
jgi:hypothetical protein